MTVIVNLLSPRLLDSDNVVALHNRYIVASNEEQSEFEKNSILQISREGSTQTVEHCQHTLDSSWPGLQIFGWMVPSQRFQGLPLLQSMAKCSEFKRNCPLLEFSLDRFSRDLPDSI